VVLLSSSCRETAKNAIKQNRRKKMTGKKIFSPTILFPQAAKFNFRGFLHPVPPRDRWHRMGGAADRKATDRGDKDLRGSYSAATA
jgi:hypothetical protein